MIKRGEKSQLHIMRSASTLLIKHQSHILLLLKCAQKDVDSHHAAYSEADLIILCAKQHHLDACVYV